MAVNTLAVGEEEVKYTVGADGYIDQVSKNVDQALGEAVGINKIDKADVPLLLECLEQCSDSDYFERGIELAIERGLKISPLDLKDSLCIEVDFVEDLKQVNRQLDFGNHSESETF